MRDEDCDDTTEVTNYNGPHDVVGLGKAVQALSGLFIIVAICLTCSGQWPAFLAIFL